MSYRSRRNYKIAFLTFNVYRRHRLQIFPSISVSANVTKNIRVTLARKKTPRFTFKRGKGRYYTFGGRGRKKKKRKARTRIR